MSGSPKITRKFIEPFLRHALREDGAWRDITSSALLEHTKIRARIQSNAAGVMAGGRFAAWVFRIIDGSIRCQIAKKEGASLKSGSTIIRLEGPSRSIFAAERSAVNLLSHLCGIATLTNIFVGKVRRTKARILDTRKTVPGLRVLEKYAVAVGGGFNHRMGLYDAVLIKTNHLRVLEHGSHDKTQVIQQAIKRARRRYPRHFIEIEVVNVGEFRAALAAHPSAILLDNMPIHEIREAVKIRNSQRASGAMPLLEASGRITSTNVRAIAKTGVDRISIGCLTHSAPGLDLSLEVL